MILYIDSSRRITAYNKTLTPAQEQAEAAKGGAVIFSGEFDFFMGEEKEGRKKEFYLNEDHTIRIEYIDILPEPAPSLTEQEQIAIDIALNVEYMVCLMEANLG